MKAIFEIVKFNATDVITASGTQGGNETPDVTNCAPPVIMQ